MTANLNPTELQSHLNDDKARRARNYISDVLSGITHADPDDLGDDKNAWKKQFAFVLSTDAGKLRDITITIKIAEAPTKLKSTPKPKPDPRQSRFDIEEKQA